MAKEELNDLSGPFNPELTFEDLSKEFLLKIMNVWQFAWVQLATAFYDEIKDRFGFDAANDVNLAAWHRMSKKVNPRYAKIANVQVNTVIDALKVLQLPLDNTMGQLYRAEHEIINENDVIVTIRNCRSLEYYEKEAPEMIQPICHVLEKEIMEEYMLNPKAKATPLKLPPRKSKDDISCQWRFTIED